MSSSVFVRQGNRVDGRVAYKGGTGPFNFNPDELEEWLEGHLPAATQTAAGGV